MLDLKLLQKNPEVVAAALAKRHSPLNMRTFEELDNKRRELLAQVEALKAERNRASAEVARLKRNGEDAEAFIASLSDLSSRISALDSATEAVKADISRTGPRSAEYPGRLRSRRRGRERQCGSAPLGYAARV